MLLRADNYLLLSGDPLILVGCILSRQNSGVQFMVEHGSRLLDACADLRRGGPTAPHFPQTKDARAVDLLQFR